MPTLYQVLLIILIWRRYPDVETRERNERAWRGCDAVGCHSNAVSFYYLWYGAIYKRQYTDKHVTLSKCMCMRASGASELRKFWHFHILKLLFLSIFCWYIENKSWFNFIWGGGASALQAPPPPPPPVRQCLLWEFTEFIAHKNSHIKDKARKR